ncbi:hypothetical protein SO802_000257 [Lithocarpus litseifolius]|uniref:chitinase n=1 Tax=Lithocarpus litseifolius TaxID=425828 RepID=A0AAW2DRG5_9ROSI
MKWMPIELTTEDLGRARVVTLSSKNGAQMSPGKRFKAAGPWLRPGHDSLPPGVFMQPDDAAKVTRESSGQSPENENRSGRVGTPVKAPPMSYNLHQVPCTSPLPSQDTWHSHDILTSTTPAGTECTTSITSIQAELESPLETIVPHHASCTVAMSHAGPTTKTSTSGFHNLFRLTSVQVGLRPIEEFVYPTSAQNPNCPDHAHSPTRKQIKTQSSSHHTALKVTEKELEVFAKRLKIAARGPEPVYFDPETVALIPQSSLEYFLTKESQKAEDEAYKPHSLPLPVSVWSLPSAGYIKINIDAAISDTYATIAVVARDHHGVPIKIWARLIKETFPLKAETAALLWAVQLAKMENWSCVIIEGDAKVCFDAINAPNQPFPWCIRTQLLNTIAVAEFFFSCSFVWISRTGNGVAHQVAKFSLLSHLAFMLLLDNLPPTLLALSFFLLGTSADDVTSVINSALFDRMLKYRNDPRCKSNGFYTYNAFVDAAKSFNGFGTTGDITIRKRELAAFLGQTSHETTGGWATAPDGANAWGYCFITETNKQAYCNPSKEWPCGPGKQYYGRGPIQLTHNYNYGPAGKAIGVDLLNNPDLVATNPTISFKTAIWFWMTPQGSKPSSHDVIIGKWKLSAADTTAGRVPGYGVITNIINGGLECGHGPDSRVADRIGFYKRYSDILGVSYGANLDCYNQKSFA